ncbi:MAG TPA: VWA domain-containing protein [Longimicrobium sp.]|nr:VWA domain-containing protein [Longimicrobium sp.]
MPSHRLRPALFLGVLALAIAGACSHIPPPPPPPPPAVLPPPPPPPAPMYQGDARAMQPRPREEFNREGYRAIVENEFADVAGHPLSTFAIDVDAASYSNVRRFLRNGTLPPRDAVRVEELVNYFSYDYPDPTGTDPFSITTEISTAPWNPAHRLVHVGIQGRRMNTRDLPASNLVFLIDVSGSMEDPNKLPLVKQAFRLLVDQLRPQDKVSIVVYAGAAGLVLEPTSGADKATLREAIESLQPGGSTAGARGIRLAYLIARGAMIPGGNNRVILATDGDFNVGVSSDAELVRLIEQERQSGVFLTVLGFGTGNYQDAKMEQLADAGNGNFAYIDQLSEARKVLVREMGGTLFTIAKDVKVQVEFNPARVKAYRLVGYENRLLAAEDFADDSKDGGELGAGHSVTALYEIIPAESDEPVRGTGPLRYQTTQPRAGAGGNELMTVALRYKDPDGIASRLVQHPVLDGGVALARTSDDFRFAAAVAEWGMLLRDSKFKGNATWPAVAELARGALADDRGGYRAEFVRLVAQSQRLAESHGGGDRPHGDDGGRR